MDSKLHIFNAHKMTLLSMLQKENTMLYTCMSNHMLEQVRSNQVEWVHDSSLANKKGYKIGVVMNEEEKERNVAVSNLHAPKN